MEVLQQVKEMVTVNAIVKKEKHRYDVQFKHQEGRLLELTIKILLLEDTAVIAPTIGDEIKVDFAGRLQVILNNKDEAEVHLLVYNEILSEVTKIIKKEGV